MLGNKIFRIKQNKTNKVINKYEDKMKIWLDSPVAFYLYNVTPIHFPTSYISPFHPLSPIPLISLSQDTLFVVSLHKLVI
jgi:hypothetical protein